MNIVRKIEKTDTTNKMTVAFDVSSKKLDYYSEIKGKVSGTSCHEVMAIQDTIKNKTKEIKRTLRQLESYAKTEGYNGLHVICEPTGSYSGNLMRISHQLGHSTAYVGGEIVSKAKVIENNDNSKDDIKDPRIIFMLSKMGKEQIYRTLPPEYQQLRDFNRMYDDATTTCTEMRCKLHHLITRLYCDYPLSKDFIYTNSGKALMEEYKYNPYRIIKKSFQEFSSTMKAFAPRIKNATLDSLYTHAKYSSLHNLSPQELGCLEQQLDYAWEDFTTADFRKRQIRSQIEEIYYQLLESGENVPIADGKVFNAFHLGRILGETGPISDFEHWRILFKYGGVNLRKRESGKYKGKVKMSKKGRIHLRGVLGKLVFRFVKKKEIFGDYYHRRKKEKIPGTKLMANVERKLLRMIFSMAKRREKFNPKRFTYCESVFSLAA